MAGMNDINVAFKQAAGDKVSLIEGRMNYNPHTAEHILEFDVSHDGFVRTVDEVLPRGADSNALVAGAIRCGTRLRERIEIPEPQAAEVEKALTQIKSGDYELVSNAEAEKLDKPDAFFLRKTPEGGQHMSKKAVGRVTEAVSAVTAQIEAASDQVVANLQKTANETIDKFGKVQTKLITPLQEANAMLDELMFDGDNYEGSEEATASLASFPTEAKPGAATAAQPQASTLGGPAPVPDWCKKVEDVQA